MSFLLLSECVLSRGKNDTRRANFCIGVYERNVIVVIKMIPIFMFSAWVLVILVVRYVVMVECTLLTSPG